MNQSSFDMVFFDTSFSNCCCKIVAYIENGTFLPREVAVENLPYLLKN